MLNILTIFCTIVLLKTILSEIVMNTSSVHSIFSSDYTLIPDYKIELTMMNPRHSVSSPGFPNENYPPNIQVIYEVELKLNDDVRQLSNRILLTFEMFSLQDSEFCTKDGLEVADTSNQIKVYCGPQVGRTILSEGSKLYIRFFTDSAIESRGYSIIIEMYNTGCSKHFTNIESGFFSSPNYPQRYYADDICVWKIDAPDDKRIFVEFDDMFEIKAHEPLCVQDYLAVSLTGDFNTHVKRYCHRIKPASMYSSGNSLLFMFNTDCCFEGKGFNAKFTLIDRDEVTTSPPPEPEPQICTCGKENTGESERIIGGKTVNPPNRYPWVVALVKKRRNNENDFYCGGAMINKQYVLTAAHCIEKEKISETRIAIGAHDSSSDPVTVQAAKFIFHPKYRNKTLFNDIALIKLVPNVDFYYKVNPICLPTEGDLALDAYSAVVAGWGMQSFDSASTVNTNLQEVELSIVSNAKCSARYGGIVLDTNICAGGEEKKDACGGDSGGPLFSKFNNKWYVVGIVSWGVSCGRKDYPGVYTRVSKYLQWIWKQTEDTPPCDEMVQPPVKPNFDNCGIPNTDSTERIVGGTEAKPFEFPWMAMIVHDRTIIGAGALISPYFVLSSASIFDNTMEWYPDTLTVYLGRHSPFKKDATAMRYSVRAVYHHPQYGKPSPYNNDLALLKLNVPEKGVHYTYKPICLPRSDAWYPPNLSLTTAGWGSSSNSDYRSNVLQKVDLNVWSEEQCEQRYPAWFTKTMLCTYKQGADTCHGDDGAPLMRFYSGRYYLAGLSSWASSGGCAVKNAPRVFSAVHANLPWISDMTGITVQ